MSKKKQIVTFIISKTILKQKKLNCVLKIIWCNNDELTLQAEKIKTLHMIETKCKIWNSSSIKS